jgi:K+/H+ antiporter YhaU regulatory subunit KhtT
LLVIKKSNKDAQKRTVIARRQDFDIMAQINFHEAEIKRLGTILNNTINRQQQQQFNVSNQNSIQNYPAQYINSFEI